MWVSTPLRVPHLVPKVIMSDPDAGLLSLPECTNLDKKRCLNNTVHYCVHPCIGPAVTWLKYCRYNIKHYPITQPCRGLNMTVHYCVYPFIGLPQTLLYFVITKSKGTVCIVGKNQCYCNISRHKLEKNNSFIRTYMYNALVCNTVKFFISK